MEFLVWIFGPFYHRGWGEVGAAGILCNQLRPEGFKLYHYLAASVNLLLYAAVIYSGKEVVIRDGH